MCFRVLMLAALLSVLPMLADTVYTYTGNPYTPAQSPYTSSDFISDAFMQPEPLAPNLDEVALTPAVSNFNDGVTKRGDGFFDGVPEPSTLSLLGTGILGSWLLIKQKRLPFQKGNQLSANSHRMIRKTLEAE